MRAKKKKRKNSLLAQKGDFCSFSILFFIQSLSFYFFLLSKPVLSKGTDTNHLHLNVNLNTGDICILNMISD